MEVAAIGEYSGLVGDDCDVGSTNVGVSHRGNCHIVGVRAIHGESVCLVCRVVEVNDQRVTFVDRDRHG